MHLWDFTGWMVDGLRSSGNASEPDGALILFLENGLFALPRQGFVVEGRD